MLDGCLAEGLAQLPLDTPFEQSKRQVQNHGFGRAPRAARQALRELDDAGAGSARRSTGYDGCPEEYRILGIFGCTAVHADHKSNVSQCTAVHRPRTCANEPRDARTTQECTHALAGMHGLDFFRAVEDTLDRTEQKTRIKLKLAWPAKSAVR